MTTFPTTQPYSDHFVQILCKCGTTLANSTEVHRMVWHSKEKCWVWARPSMDRLITYNQIFDPASKGYRYDSRCSKCNLYVGHHYPKRLMGDGHKEPLTKFFYFNNHSSSREYVTQIVPRCDFANLREAFESHTVETQPKSKKFDVEIGLLRALDVPVTNDNILTRAIPLLEKYKQESMMVLELQSLIQDDSLREEISSMSDKLSQIKSRLKAVESKRGENAHEGMCNRIRALCLQLTHFKANLSR